MTDMLERLFARFGELSACERQELNAATGPRRELLPDHDLVEVERFPGWAAFIVEGIAVRSFRFGNGQRQITAFLLPGDLLQSPVDAADPPGFRVAALTRTSIALVSRDRLNSLCNSSVAVRRALDCISDIERATTQEWLLNLGRRDAVARMAHLLCELYCRMATIDRAHAGQCELPIFQVDLADALAISPVHANRVLKILRSRKLASLQHHKLVIENFDELSEIGAFEPGYLRCGNEGSEAAPSAGRSRDRRLSIAKTL
jgi:CRP-like cAMP-binding protein